MRASKIPIRFVSVIGELGNVADGCHFDLTLSLLGLWLPNAFPDQFIPVGHYNFDLFIK